MKNLKKCLILVGVVFLVAIYFIYNSIKKQNYDEIINSEILLENTQISDAYEKQFIMLYIIGEVKNPGIIQIEDGSRLIDAIEAAGGVTENANLDVINLAYILSDAQKIYIPSIEDGKIESYITNSVGNNVIVDDGVTHELVNINTANQVELEKINGIGPSTAEKIINYRKEYGKFKTIEDIKNVPGIGEAKYKTIKDSICV